MYAPRPQSARPFVGVCCARGSSSCCVTAALSSPAASSVACTHGAFGAIGANFVLESLNGKRRSFHFHGWHRPREHQTHRTWMDARVRIASPAPHGPAGWVTAGSRSCCGGNPATSTNGAGGPASMPCWSSSVSTQRTCGKVLYYTVSRTTRHTAHTARRVIRAH